MERGILRSYRGHQLHWRGWRVAKLYSYKLTISMWFPCSWIRNLAKPVDEIAMFVDEFCTFAISPMVAWLSFSCLRLLMKIDENCSLIYVESLLGSPRVCCRLPRCSCRAGLTGTWFSWVIGSYTVSRNTTNGWWFKSRTKYSKDQNMFRTTNQFCFP